jgi:AraC-like DNA-binding protein
MAGKKLEQLTFSDIPDTISPYMIKNFIISNRDKGFEKLSFESPFSFDGIVFIICLKGSGKVKISFKEHIIEKDSIITILPKQMVERIEHSEDFLVELLAFSPDFLSDLPIPKDFDIPRKVAENPVLKISPEDVQNLLRYHTFIIETFNNGKHKLLDKIIKGLLYSLLLEIATLYSGHNPPEKEKPSSRSEEIVEQFIMLLRENYKEGRTASYYADKMFITPKYLSSTLKKVTGRSINSWIENAITIGAKILLKSTNLTVLQISEELNFPNPSYFGRFFKKNTGMTPREYREK